jgi:peptidoglycan hydrolase-like protein with peptidoglycan-binding domain
MSVRDVKAVLAHAGFYGRLIDDQQDASFLDAIRKFQKAKGLAPDGYIGPQTAVYLKNEWPEYFKARE